MSLGKSGGYAEIASTIANELGVMVTLASLKSAFSNKSQLLFCSFMPT
jgi:hypothetical protein